MAKFHELQNEIARLREDYHAKSQNPDTAHSELSALSGMIVMLNKELSAELAAGAKPCPGCDTPPMGMDREHCFEVGCANCKSQLIDVNGVTMRRSYSAQGRTPEQAVARWNAGDYLIDRKIDRNV